MEFFLAMTENIRSPTQAPVPPVLAPVAKTVAVADLTHLESLVTPTVTPKPEEKTACSGKELKNQCQLGISSDVPDRKSCMPVVELKQSENSASCGEVPFIPTSPDVISPTSPRCCVSPQCTTKLAAKPEVAPRVVAVPASAVLSVNKKILKRPVKPEPSFYEINRLVMDSKDFRDFENDFKDFVSWPKKSLARALICRSTHEKPVMCGVVQCWMHKAGIEPVVVVKEWCGKDLPPSMLQKPVVDELFMHIMRLISSHKPETPGGVFLRLLKRCLPYRVADFFCDPAHPLSSKKGVVERDYYLKLWDTHTKKLRDIKYFKFIAKLEFYADTKKWLSSLHFAVDAKDQDVHDSVKAEPVLPPKPVISADAAPEKDDADDEFVRKIDASLSKHSSDDWEVDMLRRIDALAPSTQVARATSDPGCGSGVRASGSVSLPRIDGSSISGVPPPLVGFIGNPVLPGNPPKADEPLGDFIAPIDSRYQPRVLLPFNILDPDTYDAQDCPTWLWWLREVHTPGKRVRIVGDRLDVPDWKYNDQEKVPTTRAVANVRAMYVEETPSRWFFEAWLGLKRTTEYRAVVSGSAIAVAESVIKGGDYDVGDVINQLRFSKDVIQPAGRWKLADGSVVDTLNCNRESVNYVLDRRAALGTFQQGNVRGPSRGATSNMATAQVNNSWLPTLTNSLFRYVSAMRPVMIVVSCILTWVAVFVATYYLPPTLATQIRNSLA
jgi:hypothetical protein